MRPASAALAATDGAGCSHHCLLPLVFNHDSQLAVVCVWQCFRVCWLQLSDAFLQTGHVVLESCVGMWYTLALNKLYSGPLVLTLKNGDVLWF